MSIPVAVSKGYREQDKEAGSGRKVFLQVFFIFKLNCIGIKLDTLKFLPCFPMQGWAPPYTAGCRAPPISRKAQVKCQETEEGRKPQHFSFPLENSRRALLNTQR